MNSKHNYDDTLYHLQKQETSFDIITGGEFSYVMLPPCFLAKARRGAA